MPIVDFHAHAFPDTLAPRAVARLENAVGARASFNGTIDGLIASMNRVGVEWAVVASIATRPQHFAPILDWSIRIASPRVVPFASVHPDEPRAVEQIRAIAAAGLRGVKFHPYYQDFFLDEERLFPLYREIERLELILLCHTGFDIAYPRVRRCDPARILTVITEFPRLRLVAAHLGGWEDWDAVESLLVGKPVYLDTAFSLATLGRDRARRLIASHRHDYVLFGSDCPWEDAASSLAELRLLGLPPDLECRILGTNAAALLGSRAIGGEGAG